MGLPLHAHMRRLCPRTLACLQAVPLNRYALDYYQHGQKAALVEANGLREGDAWQVRHSGEVSGRALGPRPGGQQPAAASGQPAPPKCLPPPPPHWQALSAFSDVLRVVAAALGSLLPQGCFHPVAYCLARLAQQFGHRFARFNVAAPGRRGGY